MELLKQPWFYESPNPVTLAAWALMAWYASRMLLKKGACFKRFPRLMSLINGFFIIMIIVMIQDLFFLVITAVRWVPLFPQYATLDFWMCFPRDLSVLALLFLMTWEYYGMFKLNFDACFGFAALWTWTSIIFFLVPDSYGMGITNWTYAVTEGMPDWIILVGFALNFLVGKPVIFWISTRIWKNNVLEDSFIWLKRNDEVEILGLHCITQKLVRNIKNVYVPNFSGGNNTGGGDLMIWNRFANPKLAKVATLVFIGILALTTISWAAATYTLNATLTVPGAAISLFQADGATAISSGADVTTLFVWDAVNHKFTLTMVIKNSGTISVTTTSTTPTITGWIFGNTGFGALTIGASQTVSITCTPADFTPGTHTPLFSMTVGVV